MIRPTREQFEEFRTDFEKLHLSNARSRETRHTPPVRLTGDFIGHGDDSSPVSEGGTPLRSSMTCLMTFMRSQYVANFMVAPQRQV
eukprot:s4580_g1.t1